MTKNPYKGADSFTVRAKREGYPARSVFKLEEIDRRVKLFRSGQRVLDLGAAPGSWSLYAAQRIGKTGRLLAMDLKPLDTVLPIHATFSQGDALSITNEQLALFAPYDVIVSDMAPATTGNRNADQARSFELYMRALAVAEALLAPGGHFVGKIFMGEDFSAAKQATKAAFKEERTIRPEGTRSVSYEVFLIGLQRKVDGKATITEAKPLAPLPEVAPPEEPAPAVLAPPRDAAPRKIAGPVAPPAPKHAPKQVTKQAPKHVTKHATKSVATAVPPKGHGGRTRGGR